MSLISAGSISLDSTFKGGYIYNAKHDFSLEQEFKNIYSSSVLEITHWAFKITVHSFHEDRNCEGTWMI